MALDPSWGPIFILGFRYGIVDLDYKNQYITIITERFNEESLFRFCNGVISLTGAKPRFVRLYEQTDFKFVKVHRQPEIYIIRSILFLKVRQGVRTWVLAYMLV